MIVAAYFLTANTQITTYIQLSDSAGIECLTNDLRISNEGLE